MRAPERLLWRAALGQAGAMRSLPPQAWPEAVAWAGREGVEGLLYQRCVQDGVSIPEPARGCLAAAHLATAARNLVAMRELGELLAGLARRGLEVVVLPGACLLPLLPDPGWRPMDDVDVLVPPGAGEAVRAALIELGMAPVRRHSSLLVGGHLVLDLHRDPLDCWRVRSRRHAGWIGAQEVWRERRTDHVEGVRLNVPCVEHALIYTAVHALKHAYRKLVWFVDLHGLVRQVAAWEGLAERAQQSGAERPLLYGLAFLHQGVQVDLPAAAQRWTEARPLHPAERCLLDQAMADRTGSGWGDLLWSLSARGVRRWQFLAETCFPRPAVLLQVFPRLPAPLLPLAYPLRLGQVVVRAARLMRVLLRRRAVLPGRPGHGGTLGATRAGG